MHPRAAAPRAGPGKGRRNSFVGLVELNRCVQDGKLGQRSGNDSANDAWLSQTVGDPCPVQPGALERRRGWTA